MKGRQLNDPSCIHKMIATFFFFFGGVSSKKGKEESKSEKDYVGLI